MTTRPRLGPMLILTRVSSWSASSSSSSSRPGARSLLTGGAAVRRREVAGAALAEADGLLGLADRQTLGGDAPGQRLLEGAVGRAQQDLGVTGRHLPVGHEPLHLGRELEQPQQIGHGRPALADPVGHLLLGQFEVLDQLLVGGRLLEGVEVVAVEVLDQRMFGASARRSRRAR